MIAQIIDLLQKGNFYGAGEFTEIAKGKNQIGYSFRKIKRRWQLKRKLS